MIERLSYAKAICTRQRPTSSANKANVIAMLLLAAIGVGVVWAGRPEKRLLEDQAHLGFGGIEHQPLR